jgi:flap endonuclease-1
MGIKSLTSLINKKSPDSIKTISLYTLKGKKVAIDTNIFLYRSLANVRTNGDYLRNKDGHVVSHIVGMFNNAMKYLQFGIEPIYIFDGKPPIEKKEVLDERKKKASESKELSEKSLTIEEKQKHEKNSIRVKSFHVNDVKNLFNLMGISYIHPNGEAEAYASELCRIGYVDYVVTEDMDSLVFGCPKMIRTCLDKSIKRNDVVSVIDLETTLKNFNMNMDEFTDMCILCGCDYCPTIPGVGTIRSYNHIQKYKTIEELLNSGKCINVPNEFKERYKMSRELFNIFKGKIDINNMIISSSEYKKDKLTEYLITDCSMNEKRVNKKLSKIII